VSLSFALVSAAGGIAEAPPAGFPDGSMFENIRVAVSGGVIFENVQARNIYDVEDFYDTPVPSGVIGTQTGSNGMSSFDAYGFVSNRTRTDIRRGFKRFVGVVEGAVEGFGVINGTQMSLLESIASAMSATLVYDDEGTDISFIPCVVKKLKYTTPSGKTAYKYYPLAQKETQLGLISSPVVWTPYEDKRHQDSRQRGRGR
jgi:hypothetical protein